MFTAGTVLCAGAMYLVMLVAYFLARRSRNVHIALMASVMLFDVCMPFYLYMNRDWGRRLLREGELTSYLLWTHFLLLLTLYLLYVMQIQAGRALLHGRDGALAEHRAQGRALLLVRGFVVLTGALLVEVHTHH